MSSIVTKYGFLLKHLADGETPRTDAFNIACQSVAKALEPKEGAVNMGDYLKDVRLFKECWDSVGGFFTEPSASGLIHSPTTLSILLYLLEDHSCSDKTIIWKELLEEEGADLCLMKISPEHRKVFSDAIDMGSTRFFAELIRRHPPATVYSLMGLLFSKHDGPVVVRYV